MVKNEAGQSISAFLPNINTGLPVTSGTTSVYITLDGGIQAAGAGTVEHEGNGQWVYKPTQAETNGDSLAFLFTNADAISANIQVFTTEIIGVTSDVTVPVSANVVGLTRYKIREEVRRILRDPDWAREDVNRAINSVISTLNILGRFTFHQSYLDLTLVASQKDYTTTGLKGEEVVVYRPDTEYQYIVKKAPDIITPYSEGWFITGGEKPLYYVRWGSKIWFEPVPDSTGAGQTVRVYGYFLLPLFTDDITKIALPEQLCISILAWGAASELAPNMIVESSGKTQSISSIYSANLRAMKQSEVWEPMVSHNMMRDTRWSGLGSMGFVSRVRG
jgi:hypothetical protein